VGVALVGVVALSWVKIHGQKIHLVKIHGPQINEMQKKLKKYGLSNETSLKNIGREVFVLRFYTKTVQKAEQY
jgi:hypothetical protein